ncbi:MAG: hypothetical protein M0Z79_04980 [Nitrospiraceae bacterium]|nr:hypothetical protein [Nitrospiraceae bacterium]
MSARRPQQPDDVLEERTLSAAAAAEDDGGPPLRYGDGDVLEYLPVAVMGLEPDNLDGVFRCFAQWSVPIM